MPDQQPAKKAPQKAPRAKKQPAAKKAAATKKVAQPVVVEVSARRADLEEARRLLLAALAMADVKELPSLVRELRAVALELEQLAPPEEGNVLDEISARRAARIAAANGSGRAGRN